MIPSEPKLPTLNIETFLEMFKAQPDDTPEIIALRNLLSFDDDRECRFCQKNSWNVNDHDWDCPMQQAYLILQERTPKP